MSRIFMVCCLVVTLLALSVSGAGALIKLPAVIGDNMVLQQGRPMPVWGWADPGERITVEFNGQRIANVADSDGTWKVMLEAAKAGGPFKMSLSGNTENQIILNNILVGEVWVCSGQSNMQMTVSSSNNADREIANANYPRIRLFSVKRTVAHEPQEDCEGEWVECTPQSIPGFSASAYFFGRLIHADLNVPVGLIHTSWGGTPAESWTTLGTLKEIPELRSIIERYGEALLGFPMAQREFERRLAEWQKARNEGRTDLQRPYEPMGPYHPNRPAGLYNGMIAPLLPFAIRGAIWYQGESNAGRAYQYRTLFRAMIQDWREAWGQGDFPFLFVQLANYMQVKDEPADDSWAELREAQTMTLSLPKTGMAVIIDIGEANDIHPKNKQDVGRRLALAAEGIAYNKDIVYSGPLYEGMCIEGDKARISFRHSGSGLITRNMEPIKGFAIAGADRKFHWADAKIEGGEAVVWSTKVPHPVAVRYAWAINPVCNLYNKEGLPASPFRTDDWPGVTIGK